MGTWCTEDCSLSASGHRWALGARRIAACKPQAIGGHLVHKGFKLSISQTIAIGGHLVQGGLQPLKKEKYTLTTGSLLCQMFGCAILYNVCIYIDTETQCCESGSGTSFSIRIRNYLFRIQIQVKIKTRKNNQKPSFFTFCFLLIIRFFLQFYNMFKIIVVGSESGNFFWIQIRNS